MKKPRVGHHEREAYLIAALLPAIVVIGLVAAWVVQVVSKLEHY